MKLKLVCVHFSLEATTHTYVDSPNHATTTLLELIYNTPDLSIFSKLVRERPVIADILSSEDQDLTLFAPSDSAFRGGRNPEVPFDVITQLVMYHLVDGERLSQGFQDGELLDSSLELESLGGMYLSRLIIDLYRRRTKN